MKASSSDLNPCLFSLVSPMQDESIRLCCFSLCSVWLRLTYVHMIFPDHLLREAMIFAERDDDVFVRHSPTAGIGVMAKPASFHGLISCNIIFA